jgi:GH24 family phage-related lysozyme (muramidase)
MRESVRAAFVSYTSPLEGVVPWMYLDSKGLVTVAIGNLIDPIQYALVLPFVHYDGRLAQRDEIAEEWLDIHNRPELAKLGHLAAKQYAHLRLTDQGVADLVARKLSQNDQHLRARFVEWEDWPADAQLATLSIAWACGPAFRFPRLEAALRAQDFDLAATECTIHPEVGTIVQRNAAQRVLYRNAGRVLAYKLDPDALYWPTDLTAAPADSTPTLPDTSAQRETGTLEALSEGEPREPEGES